jgi:gamma-glutamyltranspeptidase
MTKASLNADYVRTEISRWQARSMAMSTRGIAAAENPLAAQAGAVVLARGGHAVDATIAAKCSHGARGGTLGTLHAMIEAKKLAYVDMQRNIGDPRFSNVPVEAIQEALESPRFVKLTFSGHDVMMESRFPEEVRRGLESRGHEIDLQGEFSNMVGGGQAVMHDARSHVNYGGSDPQKDGAAIPEPIL